MNPEHSLRLLLSFPIPFVAGCGESPRAQAPAEDHDHAAELEPVSVTRFGERTLLFLEHPRLVRGEPARFLAHLSVLATGEPVRAGAVTLEIGPTVLRTAAPKREGLFVPEGSVSAAGSLPARLIVASEQVEETLDLGRIVVHEDRHGAVHAAEADASEEPAGAVPFLMEQQWKVKLLLAEAAPRPLARRLIVPARAAAPEGASAVVSAPLGGRLVAASSAAFPRTGDEVHAGQILALVEPPLAAPDLAQLRALDLEFDLRALEVIRAAGEAQARIRFAEREVERIGKLRAEGLSTQQQLDLAEQNLAVARSESEAAAGMKASLDALVAQRESGPSGTAARTFPLSAPIAGTLVEVRHAPGESVAPDEAVFRVLDSSRLWIEGRVLEFDLPLVESAAGAVATFSALPGRRLDLAGERAGVPYIGREVDAESRTVLVRYEIENREAAVRVGMLAELEIATGTVAAAVSIPFEAVVLDQGVPTAYVMLEGELFQKRDLELGVKDGEWVEVRRGVQPGERLATRGAYLVKLAALSPASFGPGHAH